MKSAIGIGALLMDGLGDTIRVSLTEDPEYEIDPCQRLAKLGETAWGNSWGVASFAEKSRDTHSFARRMGDLPLQLPGEEYDFRGLLHRDGTVFSSVALSDLKQADVLYKKLGAKLSVGMPFKDIATSDSIFMREIPPSSDADGRRAVRRLQEVTVHVIVPADKLAADPLPGAVTLHTLRDAVAAHKAGGVKLPEGDTASSSKRSSNHLPDPHADLSSRIHPTRHFCRWHRVRCRDLCPQAAQPCCCSPQH